MKAFLIARVSTLDQSDALPGQIYRLNDYATAKGYESELFEIKESAYKGSRISFMSVIEKIRKHPELCVVVFDKIDRYTRNSNSEEVSLLNSLCRAGLIEMHFPSDHLFINKESSAQEHFMLNMGVSSAQYYSDSISDNVKRRNQQKYRDGEWCHKAPFGYRNIELPDGSKSVEPDENANAVRDIFTWYGSGAYSMQQVRQKVKEKYGVQKSLSQIDKILKRTFYYGEMSIKGKTFEHRYATLISRNDYRLAQRSAETVKEKPRKYAGIPYEYRGAITCGTCGCSITPERSKGYIYYHCTQYRGKHNAKYVREEELTRQLMDILRAIQPTQEQYNEVLQALKLSHQDRIHYRDKRLATLQSELTKLNNRLDRLQDMYLDGDINKNDYAQKGSDINGRKKELNELIGSIDTQSQEFYESSAKVMELVRNAPEIFESSKPEGKRSILNIVLQNLELHDDQLRWKYKKPFDSMASCKNNSSWLGLVDVFQEDVYRFSNATIEISSLQYE